MLTDIIAYKVVKLITFEVKKTDSVHTSSQNRKN